MIFAFFSTNESSSIDSLKSVLEGTFEVLEVNDLSLLDQKEFDYLVCDLDIDRKNEKLIKKVREDRAQSTLIYLSNDLSSKELIKHQESKFGGDIYLRTPVDLSALLLILDLELSDTPSLPQELIESAQEPIKEEFIPDLPSEDIEMASDKKDLNLELNELSLGDDELIEGTHELGQLDLGEDEDIDDLLDLSEEDTGLDLGADDVGLDLGADDVGLDLGEDDVGLDLGEDDVGLDLGADDVGLDLDEEDSGLNLGADDVGLDLSADDSGLDLGEDDDGLDLGADDVGLDLSEEDVGLDLAEDDGGLDLGADDVGLDLGADDVGLDLGKDDNGLDLGADDVGLDLGAEDIGLDLGVDDVGLDLGEDDVGLDLGADDGLDLGVEENDLALNLSSPDDGFDLSDEDSLGLDLEEGNDLLAAESDIEEDFLNESESDFLDIDNDHSLSLDSNEEEESLEMLEASDLEDEGEDDGLDLFGELPSSPQIDALNLDDEESPISLSDDALKKLQEIDEIMMDETGPKDETNYLEEVSVAPANLDTQRAVVEQHAGELDRLGLTIRQMREDRSLLLEEVEKIKGTLDDQKRDNLSLRAELDEKKIENSILRKRYEKQVEELKYQLDLSNERKGFLEQKNQEFEKEFHKMNQRIRLDVKKIQTRERELESQIELMRADSEIQLKNRDQKILELKRKIDTLEFDLESVQVNEKRNVNSKHELEDKMERVVQTLRLAIGELENSELDIRTLDKLKKNLDV